jgi:hypothetical protein
VSKAVVSKATRVTYSSSRACFGRSFGSNHPPTRSKSVHSAGIDVPGSSSSSASSMKAPATRPVMSGAFTGGWKWLAVADPGCKTAWPCGYCW